MVVTHSIDEVSSSLATYSFEEILELNELTEEDCLFFLVEQGFVVLPRPRPL